MRRYRLRGLPTHIVGTGAVCGRLGGQVTRKMRVNYNIIYFFRSLTTCRISSGKKLIYFLCDHEYVIECNSLSFNNDGFEGFLLKIICQKNFICILRHKRNTVKRIDITMLFYDYTFISIYYLYHSRFYSFVRNPNIIYNKI